jgi:hypothetical protein
MKKTTSIFVLILLIAGVIAVYFYSQNEQANLEPRLAPAQEVSEPTVLTPPAPRLVLDAPKEDIALPDLESSDDLMTKALDKLLNNPSLMSIFINDQLINNIVVTIDNLPRKQISMRLMPIKKAPGTFITTNIKDETLISLENNARYTEYVKFAEAIDPQLLVELYVQLYPLFQKAYEALGYPDQYFNDRLLFVINHLLITPDIVEQPALYQPKYFYLYADEDFESRSIGQRILIRIGSDNRTIVKSKLNAIKQELIMHMHEQKIDAAHS